MMLRPNIGVVVVTIALLSITGALEGQTPETWLGSWKINPAKSTYNPGPPPQPFQTQTSTWESLGGGQFKNITDSINAKRQVGRLEWVGQFDGKDRPLKSLLDPNATRTRAFSRIDNRTYEYVDKVDGKVTATSRVVISPDGKFRTLTSSGMNAEGKPFNNVSIWDKQ